jgi:hypothetical protein
MSDVSKRTNEKNVNERDAFALISQRIIRMDNKHNEIISELEITNTKTMKNI